VQRVYQRVYDPHRVGRRHDQNELGETITSLWVAHANAKIASRATNQELRVLRAKLGEQLSEMKQLLAKPGRGGQWSGFLRERGIPRATADRLAARHLRSLNPDLNCVIEPISEPTEQEVEELFAAVWPKLKRTLRSRQSAELFVRLLMAHCECSEMADQESPVVTPATVIPDLPSLDVDCIVESELGAVLSSKTTPIS
jgi:hypothetical protein